MDIGAADAPVAAAVRGAKQRGTYTLDSLRVQRAPPMWTGGGRQF